MKMMRRILLSLSTSRAICMAHFSVNVTSDFSAAFQTTVKRFFTGHGLVLTIAWYFIVPFFPVCCSVSFYKTSTSEVIAPLQLAFLLPVFFSSVFSSIPDLPALFPPHSTEVQVSRKSDTLPLLPSLSPTLPYLACSLMHTRSQPKCSTALHSKWGQSFTEALNPLS